MNTTTVVLSIVAAAAVFSLALAPIGHAYAAAPVAAAAPVEADGNGDGVHDGEYGDGGDGGTCPFKNRQGASTPGAWQGL